MKKINIFAVGLLIFCVFSSVFKQGSFIFSQKSVAQAATGDNEISDTDFEKYLKYDKFIKDERRDKYRKYKKMKEKYGFDSSTKKSKAKAGYKKYKLYKKNN